MTTFTSEALASIHEQLAQCHELPPANNQVIAGVLDTLDSLIVGEYDADAAAAGLFAFAGVLRERQVIPLPGASTRDVVDFIADLASFTGQKLHAATHTTTAPEPLAPVDPARPISFAVAGGQPTREQWEALHTYRAAMFLPPLSAWRTGSVWARGPLTITAAIMNEAIVWWNRRAAALSAADTGSGSPLSG